MSMECPIVKLRYVHSKFILSLLNITLEKWWMITNNINSGVGCGDKDPRGGLELGWTQSNYIPSQVSQIINHKSQIFCDVCWTLKCRKNKKLVLQRYLLFSESDSKVRDSPLELSHYLTKYLRCKFLHECWSLMNFAIGWTLTWACRTLTLRVSTTSRRSRCWGWWWDGGWSRVPCRETALSPYWWWCKETILEISELSL